MKGLQILKISIGNVLFLIVLQGILVSFHQQLVIEDTLYFTRYYWKAAIFNLIILYFFYRILIIITRHRYFSWYILSVVILLFSSTNYFKLIYRNEPFLPSDLLMIKDGFEIFQMLQKTHVISICVGLLVVILMGIYVFMAKWDKKIQYNNKTWVTQAVITGLLFTSVFWGNNLENNYNKLAEMFKYRDSFWDLEMFYSRNGPLSGFVSLMDLTIMDKPDNYSKEAVHSILEKYQQVADNHNKNREDIADHKVIYVLSETFADPLNVPNLQLSEDPIPFVRSLKERTTSGLLFQSVIGGGTANVEYEAISSFSLGNFHKALVTPYTLNIHKLDEHPIVGDLFDTAAAIHTYSASIYKRSEVFKVFNFEEFRYVGSPTDKLKFRETVDNSNYISDASAYKEALNVLNKYSDESVFILLTTMQNHSPHSPGQFKNKIEVLNDIDPSQEEQIETYIQGLRYTDEATENLIKEIDQSDEKISVVFFGDHYPGNLFNSFIGEDGYELYQTDYFIYSNFETEKLDHPLISPNQLSSILFEEMGVKISPYYALMGLVGEKIPVIRKADLIETGNNKLISENELSAEAKQILEDYRLIQYDINVGNQYSVELGVFNN